MLDMVDSGEEVTVVAMVRSVAKLFGTVREESCAGEDGFSVKSVVGWLCCVVVE